MKIKKLLYLTIAICSFTQSHFSLAVSQPLTQSDWSWAKREQATIGRMNMAPEIDGRLDGDEWRQATKATNFVQYRPNVGSEPLYPVEVFYALDENFLYVAAKINQPSGTLTDRNMTQGTNISDEDFFGVTVDTNFDLLDGYLFQVSPSGVRQEGLVDGVDYIDEWNTIWYAKTSIEADYWTVEIAIPMQSLSFDNNKNVWGLQFRHKLSNPYQESFWNLNNPEHFPWTVKQTAAVDGFRDINQGIGLEVKAGIAGRSSQNENSWQPSLDINYKFSPNLTGIVTLNTDFSGTEVDEIAMDTSLYSVYYPEKRDFFLQDNQIFNFAGLSNFDNRNAIPFYSRSIGQSRQGGTLDLNWGAKLSGQIANTRLGLLSVNQNQDQPVKQQEEVQLSVVRMLHKIDSKHQLGAIATQGNANGETGDQTLGIDYYFEDIVFDDQVFTAKAWYQSAKSSQLFNGELETKDDKAYGLQLDLPNDKYFLSAKYQYLGEDFQPAMGFVNRNGIKRYELNSHFRYRPKSEKLSDYLNYYQAIFYFSKYDDMSDNPISKEFRVRPVMLRGKYYDYISWSFYKRWERLDYDFALTDKIQFEAGDYSFNNWRIFVENRRTGSLFGRLIIDKGKYFDADYLNIQPLLNYKPNKYLHLVASLSRRFYKINDIEDNLSFSSLRANIAFNSEWSWNTLIQHNTRAKNFSLFSRLRYQPAADQLYQLSINKGYDLEEGWHQRRSEYEEKAIKLNLTYRW